MTEPLFATAGAVLPHYEQVDWAATPLGPPAGWSATLRLSVATLLETRFPVCLMWGPEYVQLYNEEYTRLIGDKHPAALGRPVEESFGEAWPQIGPLLDSARSGESVYFEDAPIPLVRQGFLEECYFTFCYSPIRSRGGTVEGVIDIAHETTEQVVSRRRLDVLGRLSSLLGSLDTAEEVLVESVRLLRASPVDLVAVDLHGTTAPIDRESRLPRQPSRPVDAGDLVLERHEARPVVWLPLHQSSSDPDPDGDTGPVLVVETSPLLALDEDYLSFLRLLASSVGQALDRVEALALERRASAAERDLVEALQHSLLGGPVAGDGVEVAVRYRPAHLLAQIGGDWHDSFVLPDGTTAVVAGDVAGHDRDAAAAMAQVKNLLRGVAFGLPPDPARVLTAIDRAMLGLDVDTLVTAVLAYVEQTEQGTRLRWSNAGHLPPLLLGPDGRVQLLDSEPELLLGLGTPTPRTAWTADVPAGSTVLLYTDGLVERRAGTLDDGLAWLTDTAAGRQDLDPEDLCDLLLSRALPAAEDDIALVAVRVS